MSAGRLGFWSPTQRGAWSAIRINCVVKVTKLGDVICSYTQYRSRRIQVYDNTVIGTVSGPGFGEVRGRVRMGRRR